MDKTPETNQFISDDEKWFAVQERNPLANGHFYLGVVTTGIYCRPDCPSRLPKRQNVRFFDTIQAAEEAGLRACKRCRPKENAPVENTKDIIIQACQLIERSETELSLSELGRVFGWSPFYFQRLFKKFTGLSPKQYYLAQRLNRVRENLPEDKNITSAIYSAGFGSSGRFYSQSGESLGMKPAEYKNGAKGKNISYTTVKTYLGWTLIGATPAGICAIFFGDQPEELEKTLRKRFHGALFTKNDPAFTSWISLTLAFLDQPRQGLDLPLDIQGTVFQRKVWQALREIPAGVTSSYGDIAQKIGQPKAVRAVAQACGANNIAVAIPCHRVIRSNGEPGGYHWGLERKMALMTRERREENGKKEE